MSGKEKEVKVKITTEVEDSKVKSLEKELEKISSDKHNVDIETNDASSKAKSLKSDVDKVDDEQLSVKLDTTNAMVGLQSLKDGFNGLKASIQEIGQQFSQVMLSAGKYETNLAYLANSMGLDQAKGKMQEINDIVAKLPGDDTAIGGILSSAAARDSSLTKSNLESIAASAADYMSAMSYYGKTATEAQQDMTNYILTGNTAELQRSPILSSHIDKLKQATTIQERQKVLAEALNEEGWGGMSQADTYNNKLETFNGMLERGRQNLGLMFMQGSKGAMDFLIKLDGATGGMVGLTAATFGFLEPVGQGLISIGQMGQGLKTLGVNGENIRKLGGYFGNAVSSIKNLELGTKAYAVAEALANGVRKIAATAQAALNAVMMMNPYVLVALAIIGLVAAVWYLYNTNEEFRNSVNQLFNDLTRLANGDWHVVVEYEQKGADLAVDTAGNLAQNDISLGLSRMLMGDEAVAEAQAQMPAFLEQIKSAFNEGLEAFWNDGTQGVMGWLANLAGIDVGSYLQNFSNGFMQIPLWVGQAFQNTVSQFQGFLGQVNGILNNLIGNVASFGFSFVSHLGSAASNAVSAFASGLSGLVSAAWAEFNDVLNAIYDFGAQAIAAAQGIGNQITQALWQRHSPGIVAQATFAEMKDSKMFLEQGLNDMVGITGHGSDNIIGAYNPNLNNGASGMVVNNEFNFVINGDVDNDERMQKFADYIIQLMNWENDTAGRTV